MFLEICLLTPEKIIFEGKAKSIILPGEQGVFEVLPFHKRILSRLISGTLLIDEANFPVTRGLARVEQNKATIIIEQV